MITLRWIVLDILLVSANIIDEEVILKWDPQRYDYMIDGAGVVHYVDLWVKMMDLRNLSIYNPDENNLYHLYTRNHTNESQIIVLNHLDMLKNTDFDPKRRTVILVHGWKETYQGSSTVLGPAFLKKADVNVISVDWSFGADSMYAIAIINNIRSGYSVARFINWICNSTGAKIEDFHLVGFSLGGHQVGIIGRNVKGNITYITALDPAGPGWYINPYRLRASDAIYTEVITTSGFSYGYGLPLGDVTFYPNGGRWQLGCCGLLLCSHIRSFFYFAESLATGGFTSVECKNYEDALHGRCILPGKLHLGGLEPKTGKTGIYYLSTNYESPFSKG